MVKRTISPHCEIESPVQDYTLMKRVKVDANQSCMNGQSNSISPKTQLPRVNLITDNIDLGVSAFSKSVDEENQQDAGYNMFRKPFPLLVEKQASAGSGLQGSVTGLFRKPFDINQKKLNDVASDLN